MAARRTRRKTTRRPRRKQGINVVNAAQSLIIANATTQALFGTGAFQFVTQGWLLDKTTGTMGGAGNSWTLSASEIVMGLAGQGFGQSGSGPWTNNAEGLMAAVKKNLKDNGAASLGTIILVPAAFNVAKKLTSKPRRDANKLLKMAGLNTVVKV